MKKQMGGEGQEAYKGLKSDSSLVQHGGEGGDLSKKTDSTLDAVKESTGYCGPGRYLKTEGY